MKKYIALQKGKPRGHHPLPSVDAEGEVVEEQPAHPRAAGAV